jgi:hypothetical protein
VEPYVLGSFLPASKGVGSVSVELSVVGTAGDHDWDSISCQALLRIVCNFVSPFQSKESQIFLRIPFFR